MQHKFGEISPRTRAETGHIIDAISPGGDQAQNGLGQMDRVGRRFELILRHAHDALFVRGIEHALDVTVSGMAKNPGGADAIGALAIL